MLRLFYSLFYSLFYERLLGVDLTFSDLSVVCRSRFGNATSRTSNVIMGLTWHTWPYSTFKYGPLHFSALCRTSIVTQTWVNDAFMQVAGSKDTQPKVDKIISYY